MASIVLNQTTLSPPLIPLTDAYSRVLVTEAYSNEPLPGSVVMTNGGWGTAFQRFFSDGKWHPVGGGKPRSWTQLLCRRNLALVYSAPPRPDLVRSDRKEDSDVQAQD